MPNDREAADSGRGAAALPTEVFEEELARRVAAYQELELRDSWPGGLVRLDYLAVAAIVAVLTTVLYVWGI